MEGAVRARAAVIATPKTRSRRAIVTLLCAVALAPAIPSTAWAQNKPIVGFLGATTPTIWSAHVGTFTQRLRELGWNDGQNVTIEYRWAEGRTERYAEFASEFVKRKVDVIVTAGTPAVVASM